MRRFGAVPNFRAQFGPQVGWNPARLAAMFNRRDQLFAICGVVLSAKLAKCDGQVTRVEIDAFKRQFRIPPEAVRDIGRLFDQARDSADGFEAYAVQLGEAFADNRGMLEDVLAALFVIARADGAVNGRELTFSSERIVASGSIRPPGIACAASVPGGRYPMSRTPTRHSASRAPPAATTYEQPGSGSCGKTIPTVWLHKVCRLNSLPAPMRRWRGSTLPGTGSSASAACESAGSRPAEPQPGRTAGGHPDRHADFALHRYANAQEAIDRLRDPTARVSSHYVVDEDGAVLCLVPEARRAFHAGVSFWRGHSELNGRSIGIEIVNPGHEWGYVTSGAAACSGVRSLPCDPVAAPDPGAQRCRTQRRGAGSKGGSWRKIRLAEPGRERRRLVA